MVRFHLVVSHPPHADEIDYAACTKAFGLTAADTKLKVNFPAPEIWFAEESAEAAAGRCHDLAAAGLQAKTVDSDALRALPPHEVVTEVAGSEQGLALLLGNGPLEIPFDTPLAMVSVKPPEASAPSTTAVYERMKARRQLRRAASRAFGARLMGGFLAGNLGARAMGFAARAGAMSEMNAIMGRLERRLRQRTQEDRLAFFDLWFERDGALRRATLCEGGASLEPWGVAGNPYKDSNALYEALRPAFPAFHLDFRLEDVRYRKTMIGEYGLPVLLNKIDPALKDLHLDDLASRLAFLTSGLPESDAAAPAESAGAPPPAPPKPPAPGIQPAPLPVRPPAKPKKQDPFGFKF
ncbi:MAG: hypothetical protein L6R28_01325 [Planctomycetes bacterium]|nr:hypothetical protein [Planctomycetota bacterium]